MLQWTLLQSRFVTSWLCIASLAIGLTLGSLIFSTGPTTPVPTPEPTPALIDSPDIFQSVINKAIADTASIENVQAWHAEHAAKAVFGLSYRKRALERRTALIADHGVRSAGKAFLAAITTAGEDEDGKTRVAVDLKKIEAIDKEKLKRWAAIALVFLEIAEPFVPPPYNLAVHAAIMLLKLYVADQDAKPKQIFGEQFAELSTTSAPRDRFDCDRKLLAC